MAEAYLYIRLPVEKSGGLRRLPGRLGGIGAKPPYACMHEMAQV
jgi:hypothetical protein